MAVLGHDRVRTELHDREARVVAHDHAGLDGLAPDVDRRHVGDVAQVRVGVRVVSVMSLVESVAMSKAYVGHAVAGATASPLGFAG